MNASQNTKPGSTIAQQLHSIPLSQRQRNSALQAASVAELFVDAIVSVFGKVQPPRANVFAKPNLKY